MDSGAEFDKKVTADSAKGSGTRRATLPLYPAQADLLKSFLKTVMVKFLR